MVQRELTGQGVYLGRQGDDADIQVYVDLTDWLEEYGAGYGVMLFTSPDGKTWPLYTEVDADGKKMTGEITQTETARFGNGVIEARWMAGGTMMASEKYNAYILPQAFKGEVPRHITPSWVQELILGFESSRGLIDEARAVTYAAKEARDAAKESQTEAQESAASAGASAATASAAAQTATDVLERIPQEYSALVSRVDGMGSALDNVDVFAITNYSRGAKGTLSNGTLNVSNYTVKGTGTGNVVLSGNPEIFPNTVVPTSLADEYYSIPLENGVKYTLAVIAEKYRGSGMIMVELWDKLTKTRHNICSFNPTDDIHKIHTYNFTAETTDDYLLRVNLTSSQYKAIKVAIYPQNCVYQLIDDVSSSVYDCETAISGLAGRLASAETEIASQAAKDTEMQADLTAAQTRITGLTGRMTTTETDIAGLKTEDTAMQGQIDTLTGNDTTMARQIGALETRATALETQANVLAANDTAMQTDIDTLTANGTDMQGKIDGTVEAFNNANAFAITSYGRGTKGTSFVGMSVNNFTIKGTGSGIVVLTGNPGISPTSVSIASMTDDYFTIPLDSGVTYTLALFVDDPQEAGEYIRIVTADLTTKTTKMLCNFGPDATRNSIVTYDFTVDSTDKYMLQAHITNSKDKTIKVAILPPGNPYKLAAQNESTIKSIKLESTGDITDRTAEILARLTANGYCELGNGIFVVSNLEMPGGTELRGQGNATVLRLGTTLTSGSVILATSRCTVRDLTIMGADSDISFTNESTVGNKHGIKIDLYNNIDVNISNVRIKRFDGYGLYVRGFGTNTSTPPQYSNCNANNCFIDNCFAGIYCGSKLQNSVFTNCHCTNGVFGAYAIGRCHFDGCIFMDNLEGVIVKSYGASFNGCLFHDESSTAKEYALVAEDVQFFALAVTGCRFYNCGAVQVNSTGSSKKNMALFNGCCLDYVTLPIVSGNTCGILFDGCLFGEDVTASGNIQETNTGDVKLKNCYNMYTGAALER